MQTSKILMRVPQDRERRTAAGMTGRYLMTVQDQTHTDISTKLTAVGFPAATPVATAAAVTHAMPRGHHVALPHVGIAVIDPTPELEDALHQFAAGEQSVIALEPERIVRAVGVEDVSAYVRGWRDATEALSAKLLEQQPMRPPLAAAATTATATWGLIATKVPLSRFSGANIKLAVLDTGLDTSHPDFRGRQISTKNFVGDNTPFHDGVGHGTHCIGTAAGPFSPAKGPRYGVAYESQIFAGRVLDDTGRGGDFNIIQGIDWAMNSTAISYRFR
jgi:subtilisin family serine protease